MSTPKKAGPGAYPEEYGLVLRRAAREQEFRVTLPSNRRAKAMRKSLYAFRETLELDPAHDVELLFVARAASFIVRGRDLIITVPKMRTLTDL